MLPINLANSTRIDLSSGWTTLWGAFSSALGTQVQQLMLMVGAAICLFAALAWLWKKKRGGGGGGEHKALLITFVVGAILAAPNGVLPIFLKIIDLIVNFGLALSPW